MRIRLTTIAENSAGWLGLLAEWGLSILVETEEKNILVDTGRSHVAAYNAQVMNVDPAQIDHVMFSHGHEDHTGGLVDLLLLRNKPDVPLDVIAHPDAWAAKYWRSSEGDSYKYIGIPYIRRKAESLGASFRLTSDPVWLTDRIVTSGEVPMVTDFEEIDDNACVETDTGFVSDPLDDDQSLFIVSDRGLILVCGCAHRGIINTICRAQELTGCDEIYAVVGGIHLFSASERRVQLTLDEFRRLDIKKIGVSHCTGPIAGAYLAHALGDRFFFNQAGTCTEFDV